MIARTADSDLAVVAIALGAVAAAIVLAFIIIPWVL